MTTTKTQLDCWAGNPHFHQIATTKPTCSCCQILSKVWPGMFQIIFYSFQIFKDGLRSWTIVPWAKTPVLHKIKDDASRDWCEESKFAWRLWVEFTLWTGLELEIGSYLQPCCWLTQPSHRNMRRMMRKPTILRTRLDLSPKASLHEDTIV